MDLEVPGAKDKVFCEKCFAIVAKAAEFCPECGAPMASETPGASMGSDAEVYPQLAQANLHRMRGDYKQAEDMCLQILRRYPNNAGANTLLGDICADKEDWEQAVEWYELALDLIPESKLDQEKLENAKSMLAAKAQAVAEAKVEQTAGVAPRNRFNWPAAIAIAVAVVAVAAAGLSSMLRQTPTPVQKTEKPLVLNDPPQAAPVVNKTEPNATNEEVGETAEVLSDRIMQTAGLDRNRLKAFAVDVKSNAIRMTLELPEGDEDWAGQAKAILAAFELASACPSVELHTERAGAKVHAHAAISRATWLKTQDPQWKQETGGTEQAIINLFFGAPVKEEPTAPTPSNEEPQKPVNENVPTDMGPAPGTDGQDPGSSG